MMNIHTVCFAIESRIGEKRNTFDSFFFALLNHSAHPCTSVMMLHVKLTPNPFYECLELEVTMTRGGSCHITKQWRANTKISSPPYDKWDFLQAPEEGVADIVLQKNAL